MEPVWAAVFSRNYKISRVLGQGSYGTVVKATSLVDGTKVAIKHVLVELEFQYQLVKIVREAKIMQFLNNSEAQNAGMDMFFAGLRNVFCPDAELV